MCFTGNLSRRGIEKSTRREKNFQERPLWQVFFDVIAPDVGVTWRGGPRNLGKDPPSRGIPAPDPLGPTDRGEALQTERAVGPESKNSGEIRQDRPGGVVFLVEGPSQEKPLRGEGLAAGDNDPVALLGRESGEVVPLPVVEERRVGVRKAPVAMEVDAEVLLQGPGDLTRIHGQFTVVTPPALTSA